MVRVWQVRFDGSQPGPEGDYTIPFIDYIELTNTGDYFTLHPQFIESLQEYIETQYNYIVIGNIKTVLTPEGKEWTKRKVWVLLGLYSIDAVQEINVGTLVSEKSKKDWEVLGCYPPKMIKFPIFTLSFIKDYIQAHAQHPEKFIGVHIIKPSETIMK